MIRSQLPMRLDAERVACGALLVIWLGLAFAGASTRGIIAEEVQPFLPRYPVTLEARPGGPQAMPPYEPDAPAGPRWIHTAQWPVLAWQGEARIWPVFIRGHQTALGSYAGIALGPLLGGGIAGARRSSALLGLALLLLTLLLARRLEPFDRHRPLLATALMVSSFGFLFFSRTAYAFELSSRVLMIAALALAVSARGPNLRRLIGVGVVTGLAILSRATIASALLPALAVVLWAPERRPRRSGWLAFGGVAVGLPVLAVAVTQWLVGFREGTAPLAGFPIGMIGERLLAIPDQLTLQLAWLGDPTSVLRPILLGSKSIDAVPFGVLPAALPSIAAAVRWRRGEAALSERMFLAALGGNVLAGAVLYGSPDQFQLAMALEPLFVLAVIDQLRALAAVRRAPAIALGLVLAVVRVQGLVGGLVLDGRIGNPMLSGRTQRATAELLEEAGATGPEVITTTYNHAGVLEAWTEGRLQPVHAWPVLRGHDPKLLAKTWRALLEGWHPKWVLLSDGESRFEGPFTDRARIEATLRSALESMGGAVEAERGFATESGAPGWRLLRLRLPASPADRPTASPTPQ